MAVFVQSHVWALLPLLLSLCFVSLAYRGSQTRTGLNQCIERCRETEKEVSELLQCARHCEKEYGGQGTGIWMRDDEEDPSRETEQGEREREQKRREHEEDERQRNNPYFFQSHRMTTLFKSNEGHMKVLEKFSKRSELLSGINNYRLAVVESNPNTFIVPHHCDADAVIVVLRGKPRVTISLRDTRKSYDLECGDVMKVSAGATVYLINRDEKEKCTAAILARPLSMRGEFKEYFPVGGEDPESLYSAFSDDILQTSFNTPKEQLQKLFGKQKQGVILRASREQLEALGGHAASEKERGRESLGPFSIKKQQPIYSNKFGKFYEASPDHFKQLVDLGISVTAADIKQGALMVPHYNTRTTVIVLVVSGRGRFEMACPHLAEQRKKAEQRRQWEQLEGEEEKRVHYESVRADLSPGDVFIIPAGHPVAVAASEGEDLLTIGFGIDAINNERNFLAGGDNILNQVEKTAKELAFNVPADFVEKIFKNQKESHFVSCPKKGHSLASVLDLPGFF